MNWEIRERVRIDDVTIWVGRNAEGCERFAATRDRDGVPVEPIGDGYESAEVAMGVLREDDGSHVVTIRNTNSRYGAPLEFTGATVADAVTEMQSAIRECGEDFAGVEISSFDYEIVDPVSEGTANINLGEFGRDGGKTVYVVRLVEGHESEIRSLWAKLDIADAVEEDKIFARLIEIGAAKLEG